jgi:sigma-B regulation protein RsbU (phosphoserine phosphatase)
MPHNPIERETIPCHAGDTFVLFSDGISEAINPEEGFYGEDRLLRRLSECSGAPPKDIVTRVLSDVREFAAGAKQSDDITIVVAQHTRDGIEPVARA